MNTLNIAFATVADSDKTFQQEAAENSIRKYDINRRRLIHRAKVKSFRISVVIVAAFIVWWTPYYSMMIIFMFLNPDKHVSMQYFERLGSFRYPETFASDYQNTRSITFLINMQLVKKCIYYLLQTNTKKKEGRILNKMLTMHCTSCFY